MTSKIILMCRNFSKYSRPDEEFGIRDFKNTQLMHGLIFQVSSARLNFRRIVANTFAIRPAKGDCPRIQETTKPANRHTRVSGYPANAYKNENPSGIDSRLHGNDILAG